MKQKITKKIWILAIAVFGIAAVGLVIYFLKFQNTDGKEKIAIGENQRVVYGYLTSVLGNEISYREVEDSVVEAMLERQEEAEKQEQKADEQQSADDQQTTGNRRGNRQEQTADSGEETSSDMEDGDGAGGTPPDMRNGGSTGGTSPDMGDGADVGGTLSDMGDGADAGGTPSDMGNGDGTRGTPSDMGNGDDAGGTPPNMGSGESTGGTSPDMENGSAQEGMSSDVKGNRNEGTEQSGEKSTGMGSGESVTALIPVGTVVHTTTDTETTFSRLAAGDLVKFLLETTEDGEETILEIWMVQ